MSSFIFWNKNRLKVSVTDYKVLNLPEQLKLFYFLTRGQPHLCTYAEKPLDSRNCLFIKVDMLEPYALNAKPQMCIPGAKPIHPCQP